MFKFWFPVVLFWDINLFLYSIISRLSKFAPWKKFISYFFSVSCAFQEQDKNTDRGWVDDTWVDNRNLPRDFSFGLGLAPSRVQGLLGFPIPGISIIIRFPGVPGVGLRRVGWNSTRSVHEATDCGFHRTGCLFILGEVDLVAFVPQVVQARSEECFVSGIQVIPFVDEIWGGDGQNSWGTWRSTYFSPYPIYSSGWECFTSIWKKWQVFINSSEKKIFNH